MPALGKKHKCHYAIDFVHAGETPKHEWPSRFGNQYGNLARGVSVKIRFSGSWLGHQGGLSVDQDSTGMYPIDKLCESINSCRESRFQEARKVMQGGWTISVEDIAYFAVDKKEDKVRYDFAALRTVMPNEPDWVVEVQEVRQLWE